MKEVQNERMMVLKDGPSWIVSFLIGTLLGFTLLSPVTAFSVIDQATCREIDLDTLTCKERTSEFLVTDEWAYLWFRGTIESSDIGAKVEFKFYDPYGGVFAKAPAEGLPAVGLPALPGETVAWMGIGIKKALIEGGAVSSEANSTDARASLERVREHKGPWPTGTFGYARDGPLVYIVWGDLGPQPALDKLGEWRAEFTLDGEIVVSQRFTIGKTATATRTIITTATTATPTIMTTAPRETTVTTPIARETQLSAPGLPSNMILIAAIAVLVAAALVAWRLLLRRGKVPMPPAVEAARPTPARPPLAPETRIPVPPLAPAAVAPARRALESPVGAKYCIECGELIPEVAVYCPRCASKQE